MRRTLTITLAGLALFALCASCSKPSENSGNANQPAGASANSAGGTSASAANKSAAGADAPKRYDVVFALKGARQPSDNKLAEQKRQFVNILIPNYVTSDEYGTLNLDQKFKDVTNLGLKDDERVYVITIAPPVGKKIEKGDYKAYGDEKAVESIPANEGLAVISRYDASGVKRTSGTVKVTVADERLVMVLFKDLGDTLGLKDISYGAPYKN